MWTWKRAEAAEKESHLVEIIPTFGVLHAVTENKGVILYTQITQNLEVAW